MSRWTIVIRSEVDRLRATKWTEKAPLGMRIDFKAAKRSLPQNDRLWAMLTDVAQQAEHCCRKYTPVQWKVLFMHACGREVQFMQALDGTTFIPWGQSSSDLSKDEMSELIECIFAWGAQNGVTFNDPEEKAA